jgi:hypothetical protein
MLDVCLLDAKSKDRQQDQAHHSQMLVWQGFFSKSTSGLVLCKIGGELLRPHD